RKTPCRFAHRQLEWCDHARTLVPMQQDRSSPQFIPFRGARAFSVATVSVETPIGALCVASDDRGLCAAEFADRPERLTASLQRRFGAVDLRPGDPFGAAAALRAYFAGELTALDALPLSLGGTAFQ